MAAGVSKANSIDGGNTCVIKCMIKLSEADLHMNSQIRTVWASAKIENRKSKISRTSRKSKFPYISYIFTGKLDLTDVHLPDVYLPGVRPRRLIPRRRASYVYRRAPRTQACTLRACISRACNIWLQERTFLLPTSTSNGKAEQSHFSDINSASFRRRQGTIPPATSEAEQGLTG